MNKCNNTKAEIEKLKKQLEKEKREPAYTHHALQRRSSIIKDLSEKIENLIEQANVKTTK